MSDMSDLIYRLRDRLGPAGVLTDPVDTDPYCEDWRRLYRGRTPAVIGKPNSDWCQDPGKTFSR